jgi:hypothetical protein
VNTEEDLDGKGERERKAPEREDPVGGARVLKEGPSSFVIALEEAEEKVREGSARGRGRLGHKFLVLERPLPARKADVYVTMLKRARGSTPKAAWGRCSRLEKAFTHYNKGA